MNPEAQELRAVTAQTLQELLNTLTQAKAFIISQAPDIAQEMLRWAVLSGILYFVLWVVAGAVLCKAAYTAYTINDDVPKFILAIFSVFGGIAFIPLTIFTIGAVYEAAQALCAPKVYLIEHISSLIKGL